MLNQPSFFSPGWNFYNQLIAIANKIPDDKKGRMLTPYIKNFYEQYPKEFIEFCKNEKRIRHICFDDLPELNQFWQEKLNISTELFENEDDPLRELVNEYHINNLNFG